MMIGDALSACFSIHWEQQKRGAVSDGEAWARGRLKRLGLNPEPSPPATQRFSACTWAHGVQSEEDKKTTHWFGYSAGANLLLGVKVNGVLPDPQRDLITQQVLPSLETTPADRGTSWAMYDLSFVSPPGFSLVQRHLYMGDVALEFRKNRRESLLLRQVYPADLALARRDHSRWLLIYPFKEHRRLRKSRLETTPWEHPVRRELVGIRQRGLKRLGFPLWHVAPRKTHAMSIHDQSLNRLLIAEHLYVSNCDESICEQAIASMNQPLREGKAHASANPCRATPRPPLGRARRRAAPVAACPNRAKGRKAARHRKIRATQVAAIPRGRRNA
jgi:hypothetical protein